MSALLERNPVTAQLKDLRLLLRSAAHSEDGASLFKWLYCSWCHSVGAVLSICFLSEVLCHLHDLATLRVLSQQAVKAVVHADEKRAGNATQDEYREFYSDCRAVSLGS